ncbi:uncharacterized protein DFL_001256 [Arthrobotrys flagrans]|uniref:Uncharacterized protein n=1 Tax=Arthrobotrys flagrans TaxID=97331 RepID=A0A437AGM4_ARTFL|nr:hypothetical protein DFL_001256 [Arthrobotrys flagrans]
MAPTPASTDFQYVLVPRAGYGTGHYLWLKWILVSVFCFIFLVFIIRIIYWYHIYDRQQREWISWYHWNSRQREERMRQHALAQQQQQQHARAQQHQRTLHWTAWERQQNRNTRPNMRTVPVAPPQPAVLRMHIVTPPPQPPPPPPVNLMFVVVNAPDTDNDDGVPRRETRNAQTSGSPTHTNQYRREGITRANEGSERGHQRTPSRASSRNQARMDSRNDREHQRTPSRTQPRNQPRPETQAIDEAPPAYRP